MTDKNAHKSPPGVGSIGSDRPASEPSASQRAIDLHRFGSYEVAAEDRLRWLGEQLPSMALEDTLPPTQAADPESTIRGASECPPAAQLETARADLDKTQPSLRARLNRQGIATRPPRGSATDRVKRFAVPLAVFLSVFVLALVLLRLLLRAEAPTLASPIATSNVGAATAAEASEPARQALPTPAQLPTLAPPTLASPLPAVVAAANPASRATSTRASASRPHSLDGAAGRVGGPASAPSATSVPAPPPGKSAAPDFEAPFTPQ